MYIDISLQSIKKVVNMGINTKASGRSESYIGLTIKKLLLLFVFPKIKVKINV